MIFIHIYPAIQEKPITFNFASSAHMLKSKNLSRGTQFRILLLSDAKNRLPFTRYLKTGPQSENESYFKTTSVFLHMQNLQIFRRFTWNPLPPGLVEASEPTGNESVRRIPFLVSVQLVWHTLNWGHTFDCLVGEGTLKNHIIRTVFNSEK